MSKIAKNELSLTFDNWIAGTGSRSFKLNRQKTFDQSANMFIASNLNKITEKAFDFIDITIIKFSINHNGVCYKFKWPKIKLLFILIILIT